MRNVRKARDGKLFDNNKSAVGHAYLRKDPECERSIRNCQLESERDGSLLERLIQERAKFFFADSP